MSVSLPPGRVIAAALRTTTETLARELVDPDGKRPVWTPFEWRVARAALAIHGIAPLIAGRLHWSGPDDWDDFLLRQRIHVATRHQRIELLLDRIDSASRRVGIAILALKGAALHRRGVCRVGERPMGDIDLLVRPEEVGAATAMLLSLGYAATATTWRHGVFVAGSVPPRDEFGELPDSQIKIELHSRIAERLPASEVDITPGLLPDLATAGLRDYASNAALMRHLLLHAAGNMVSKWLRLLQLHDIDALARLMTTDDWQQLAGDGERAHGLWWAYPPLRLTERYFSTPIPVDLLAGTRRHCPPQLRWICEHALLTDVSSSSLWVRAAPGFAWARTPAEAARYIRSRIRPPAGEIQVIGRIASAQSWAADGSWYSLPQYRRIWKWLTARPARPQILQAVRLAQIRS